MEGGDNATLVTCPLFFSSWCARTHPVSSLVSLVLYSYSVFSWYSVLRTWFVLQAGVAAPSQAIREMACFDGGWRMVDNGGALANATPPLLPLV